MKGGEYMHNEIQQCISNGEWEQAAKLSMNEMQRGMDATLCILVATIQEHYGDFAEAKRMIMRGLQIDPENYELYYMLGAHYEKENLDQAYLCYEQALYYCKDDADRAYLETQQHRLSESGDLTVHPMSFVILSYHNLPLIQDCLNSIRMFVPRTSYEIVVVDNASDEETVNWLKAQEDIVLIANQENMGFPGGCNQGARAAAAGNDIMLLNNDTIVTPNSMFWLRMGLYADATNGAAGCVTNPGTAQQSVGPLLATTAEGLVYGKKNNVPICPASQEREWLTGFAVVIRREIWDRLGGLDEVFSPGMFEDTDLGYRIRALGYKNVLCHNSYIIHLASQSFGKDIPKYSKVYQRNLAIMQKKWNTDRVDFRQPLAQIEKTE